MEGLRRDGGFMPADELRSANAQKPRDALRLEGFSFSYPGSAPVLRDVDMSVREGAFAVLFGPTGSGKSTLLRCMKREISPVGDQSGRIVVLGEDVSRAARTPDVGFVFQMPEAQIVCDSVWQELAFGLESQGLSCQEMHRRVAEVVTLFGLEGCFDARTSDLSGGQKQLLNLASVIAMRPRILLLDEPTSQLDPISARHFMDAAMHLNLDFGITVVVTTHDPEALSSYATDFFKVEEGSVFQVDASSLEATEAKAPSALDEANSKSPSASDEANPKAARPQSPSETVVSLKGVWYAYGSERTWIAKGMDIDATCGEVLALVGANGSGKTTLLKLVAGILEPKRGKVANSFAGSQAYIPQDPRLLFYCNTVEEELFELKGRTGCSDADIRLAIGRFGLQGLEGRNPLDLSGGQQQCLALAKVSLLKPRLFLLDEPAKGLDAASQLAMALELRRLAEQGATVLLSSHDLSFASRVADRMALLFDGQVAAVQPSFEFSQGNFFYRPKTNMFTRMFDEACPDVGRIWASQV